MKYEFPVNLTLNEVREAIAGRPEFIEANRGNHIIFNYNVVMPDTFPDPSKVAGGSSRMREQRQRQYAILRECRGLIFSPDGELLSRRYHKFFNMNEREETQGNIVTNRTADQEYVVLDKLDGSMITPILLEDKFIRWGTKMGFSDVAQRAEIFAASRANYTRFAKDMHSMRITPLFEYVAPTNRIVIPYAEENLILTGLRDMIHGNYYAYRTMQDLANIYDIPIVDYFQGDWRNVHAMEHLEGAILRFEDGHMVKIKADWYVGIHKALDSLRFEKDVLAYILDGTIDDIKANVAEDIRRKIDQYAEGVMLVTARETEKIFSSVMDIRKKGIDRKTFAVKYVHLYPTHHKNIIFKVWDMPEDALMKEIAGGLFHWLRNHTGSQNAIDSLHKAVEFKRFEV